MGNMLPSLSYISAEVQPIFPDIIITIKLSWWTSLSLSTSANRSVKNCLISWKIMTCVSITSQDIAWKILHIFAWGHSGHDRKVVGFITTYAISAYHLYLPYFFTQMLNQWL
jgi:hypothetical protein